MMADLVTKNFWEEINRYYGVFYVLKNRGVLVQWSAQGRVTMGPQGGGVEYRWVFNLNVSRGDRLLPLSGHTDIGVTIRQVVLAFKEDRGRLIVDVSCWYSLSCKPGSVYTGDFQRLSPRSPGAGVIVGSTNRIKPLSIALSPAISHQLSAPGANCRWLIRVWGKMHGRIYSHGLARMGRCTDPYPLNLKLSSTSQRAEELTCCHQVSLESSRVCNIVRVAPLRTKSVEVYSRFGD